LVAVSGKEVGWHAVDQAIEVAKHEDAQLRGLHVISSEEHRDSNEVQAIEAEFYQRCEGAGVQGRLAIAVDGTANAICSRARWTDLVVANLAFPPPLQPWARVGSGFRTLIRRCPRPILAVPSASYPLEHALLAYDGSPKGKEALFVATYLAYQWKVPLTVVTVSESGRTNQATLENAQDYLTKHKVEANLLQKNGEVAKTILKAAEEEKCDLIIMGGYGLNPLLEVVLGSTVDHILRAGKRPVLICR
jgi:nucleotide-binding universal stress UspA family protein